MNLRRPFNNVNYVALPKGPPLTERGATCDMNMRAHDLTRPAESGVTPHSTTEAFASFLLHI